MKTKFLLSLCFVTCATMASAQLESKMGNYTYEAENGWQGLRISYNPAILYDSNGDDWNFNGFSVNYAKAFSLSYSSPLFLETGVGFLWTKYSDKESVIYEEIPVTVDTRMTVASFNIPVNLAYQCSLSNSVSLIPYVGLNLKGYVLGELAVSAETEFAGEKIKETETINLFDDAELYEPYNRIAIGWQAGVNLMFDRFLVGVSYGTDLTEFNDGLRFSTASITLGVDF